MRFISGIGTGMVIVSALVACYYNMIIAWAFFYLFSSFTSSLPWETCDDPDYNTECKFPFVDLFQNQVQLQIRLRNALVFMAFSHCQIPSTIQIAIPFGFYDTKEKCSYFNKSDSDSSS